MPKRVYSPSEHRIDHRKIDRDALRVLKRLHEAGHTAYLVGGSVRDLLLQRQPKDYDISTSATPQQMRRLFRNCILVGQRFVLAHVRFGKKTIEVATFRSGSNTGNALIVQDNQWGTPEEDVLRRDFTINALLYDAKEETLIDYIDGYCDLQQRYLRTIGKPLLRFRQDPVRMIRLLKFHARFGFRIDRETRAALHSCRQEIVKSAKERVLEELLRMLEEGVAKKFFPLMIDSGMLSLMLPAVAAALDQEEGQTMQALLEAADQPWPRFTRPAQRALLLSCLAFPLLQKRLPAEPAPITTIQQAAKETVQTLFCDFLRPPRQLQLAMTAILTAQYRWRERRSRRRSQDPNFPLALRFLQLRAHQQPELQPLWQRQAAASKQRRAAS